MLSTALILFYLFIFLDTVHVLQNSVEEGFIRRQFLALMRMQISYVRVSEPSTQQGGNDDCAFPKEEEHSREALHKTEKQCHG